MELVNELLPPLPNIKDIGPEETAETNKDEIQVILMKHLKFPDWEATTDFNHITVICNFKHITVMSVKNIIRTNVSCSDCYSKITELSEIIYSTGIDKKIFAISRINKLGQVVMHCLDNGHKLRFVYDIQCPRDLPTHCLKCAVVCPSPISKFNENDLTTHLQNINLSRLISKDSESEIEEHFKYDLYLHNSEDEMSDCKLLNSNSDLDMEEFGNASYTDSDNDQHNHSGGCCSENGYENYFDRILFDDESNSNEEEVTEELEGS